MALTQARSFGAHAGGRYGSFSGKTATAVNARKLYRLDEMPLLPAAPNLMRIAVYEQLRRHAQEVNRVKAGLFAPRLNTASAPPSSGMGGVGDFVANESLSELGTAGAKYVIEGWVCIVAGEPGTWVEKRFLTGN